MKNNIITTENVKKYVQYLETNKHKIDLINYLHDLNNQLNQGKNLQHFEYEDENDYHLYFKTNINKINCRKTYCFKKTEFEYFNFGLMLGNESFNESKGEDYFLFENGTVYVDEKTNTVMLRYYISGNELFITENNHQLNFFEMNENEFKKFEKERKSKNLIDYMIDNYTEKIS